MDIGRLFFGWWNYFNWRSFRKRLYKKDFEKNEIKKNIESIKKVFKKILDTSNKKTAPIFVDNAKWLTKLNYIQFLREIGSQFTINKMLTFDSVKIKIR